MKKIFTLSLLMATAYLAQAQETYRMWVFLSDKGDNATERLAHPEKYLSPAALEIRQRKNIAIDESDLPVASQYVQQLAQGGKVLSSSRWLNAVAMDVSADCLLEIQEQCFVSGMKPVAKLEVARETHTPSIAEQMVRYEEMQNHTASQSNVFDYGEATLQAEMLRVNELHQKGLTGKGVRVAVFDAGFDAANEISVFKHLFDSKRILNSYDFVDDDKDVFDTGDHGTMVLSCIAANEPGTMVGTAPDASFYLCRTENDKSETQREEHNWVRAMEWVDSLGVDVIHASLGYSNFDQGIGSYTYEDMDGNTAICTKAADKAAAKGIIVTVSAGNEGDGEWHHITAPSDGDSVLCVGAVTKTGKKSGFSSFGPSADGQVKPDVMALGTSATVAYPSGSISTSNGTSFAGPIMAGMLICLKSGHKSRNNMEIIQAVRLAGDQYNFPDDEYGYGIPDAVFADSLLANVKDLSSVIINNKEKPVRGKKIDSKPKPAEMTRNPKTTLSISGDVLTVKANGEIETIEVRRDNQRVIFAPSLVTKKSESATFNIKYLQPGDHYLYIKTSRGEERIPFKK